MQLEIVEHVLRHDGGDERLGLIDDLENELAGATEAHDRLDERVHVGREPCLGDETHTAPAIAQRHERVPHIVNEDEGIGDRDVVFGRCRLLLALRS
jgi:hypothetical protein